MDHINTYEKNLLIDDIPALVIIPKNKAKLHPTVILYHGWGSSVEKQRFRGIILSNLGFQVIIPCAIHHGTRDPIDHSLAENAGQYFWKIIFQNIDESNKIIDYAIKELNADPKNIGVCGNSMGGFTAAGVFATVTDLYALVVFNGSCNWDLSNEMFIKSINMYDITIPEELQNKLDMHNPMKNLEHIINRPILMLHGDSDTSVDIRPQIEFYEKTKDMYTDSDRLKFIEYPNLNHFVTTNMMEEAYIWFNKYLS
ncbi:MAG: prolyl oligopeptidase family serine peptidase [Tissierellia bacterium]|nr:prolyl oligopeptidase family serine peptidase [Tissierellia bacterium]MDD4725739.1 prolyl oligopeptidase family serine peptidase [Tissierellia bacterium]